MTARVARAAKPAVTILDAIDDPQLFGRHFRNAESWAPWRAFLAALFGLPLKDEQRQLFQQCTGRERPPEGGSNEAWLVCGRRGGKSFILATIAVYLQPSRTGVPIWDRASTQP